MSLQIGTRVGVYEVTAAIGSGGMGQVYRARDTTLGRDVALKVTWAAHSGNYLDARRVPAHHRQARLDQRFVLIDGGK